MPLVDRSVYWFELILAHFTWKRLLHWQHRIGVPLIEVGLTQSPHGSPGIHNIDDIEVVHKIGVVHNTLAKGGEMGGL